MSTPTTLDCPLFHCIVSKTLGMNHLPPTQPRVELSVAELRGDFNDLKFGLQVLAGVTGIGLTLVGGVMYFGAGQLSSRMDRVEEGQRALQQRIDALPDRINDRLDQLIRGVTDAYRAGQGDRPPTPPTPAEPKTP